MWRRSINRLSQTRITYPRPGLAGKGSARLAGRHLWAGSPKESSEIPAAFLSKVTQNLTEGFSDRHARETAGRSPPLNHRGV